MKTSDIDRIEIEGKTVTVYNKDGEAIASSVYYDHARAIEVANDLMNKKIKAKDKQ